MRYRYGTRLTPPALVVVMHIAKRAAQTAAAHKSGSRRVAGGGGAAGEWDFADLRKYIAEVDGSAVPYLSRSYYTVEWWIWGGGGGGRVDGEILEMRAWLGGELGQRGISWKWASGRRE